MNRRRRNGNNKNEASPMDLGVDSNKTDESKTEGKTKKKSRGHYYNPLVYHTNVTGKTYYYQYFKPYSHDYRMLQNDEKGEPIECTCPRGKIHHFECPWYNPDVIYILDTKDDLSASEQAAQQKIYNMYQNTKTQPTRELWLWNCSCNSLHGT